MPNPTPPAFRPTSAFHPTGRATVRQPGIGCTTIAPTLEGGAIVVIGTYGERVRVRYANGEERDFHQSELGAR